MEVQEITQDEALSDYGSEFSPEEELLLNDLLRGLPTNTPKVQIPSLRGIEDASIRDSYLPPQLLQLRKAHFRRPAKIEGQSTPEVEVNSSSHTEVIGRSNIYLYVKLTG